MVLRAKISSGGKIAIPAVYRKKLHMKEGEEILIDLQEENIVITSLRTTLERTRNTIRKYHSKEESLVDKLIKHRRQESKHE